MGGVARSPTTSCTRVTCFPVMGQFSKVGSLLRFCFESAVLFRNSKEGSQFRELPYEFSFLVRGFGLAQRLNMYRVVSRELYLAL